MRKYVLAWMPMVFIAIVNVRSAKGGLGQT
jgi:hypothetical protein